MKKYFCLVLSILLLISLGNGCSNQGLDTEDTTTENLPQSFLEGMDQVGREEIEGFMAENWPQFQASFDEQANILTLTKTVNISYEEACAVGGSTYTGDLAPEAYLDQVETIALDIQANFYYMKVNVILSYLSEEGTPIFSVSDDGSVETCWE